jgi:nucleotide-binding universal stress UspA family protein
MMGVMTHTWIVGLDGSDGSASALRWAADLAERRNERVNPIAVWHVPFPIWLMSGRRGVDVDRVGIKAEVAVLAADAVAKLDNATVVDEPQVLEGHPAPTMLEMASPDTPLVVGRRGISEVKHRLLGSVSQYLVTHSPGPVVVVPDDWETSPLQRIVVGFDGSEYAAAALRWALSIAPADAEVEALMAIDVIPWLTPETVVDRHPEAVTDARGRISAVADEVDPDGRATRNFVLHGPRHALSESMRDADLVVVGPRGIGGLASAVLGSVTSWLLHEAPCPVGVVPTAE